MKVTTDPRKTSRWRRAYVLATAGASLATVVALEAPPRAARAEPAARSSTADAGAPAPPSRGIVVPPALEDVEQMCALLTSCTDVPIPASMLPHDFDSCVKTMWGSLAEPAAVNFSLTLRECGLGANSCSSLRSCALRGAHPQACAGRGRASAAGFCDSAGRAISCWHEKLLAVRDCPRGGEQCSVRGGEAACSLGACPADIHEGAPPICSASGTRILRCEKGRLASLDCAAFGLRCVTLASGPACATTGRACTEGAVRCEGRTAVGCSHGHEVRIDCGAAGLACGGRGTQVGSCTLPVVATPDGGGTCDPTDAPRCAGAHITYCAAGRPRSYFCKAMGFARCVSDKRGVRCAG